MASQVAIDLDAYGVRAPLQLNSVRQGPVSFLCDWPDNATTAVNLKTAATYQYDPILKSLGGSADNVSAFMIITAVQYRIMLGVLASDTAALINDALQTISIKHVSSGSVERYVPLVDATTSGINNPTGTNSTAIYSTLPNKPPMKLASPLAVSLRRDPTFEFNITKATDWGSGALSGILVCYGYIMADADDLGPIPCVSETQAQDFARGKLKASKIVGR